MKDHMRGNNGEMKSGGTDPRVRERPKPLSREVIHRIEKLGESGRTTNREHYPPVPIVKKK